MSVVRAQLSVLVAALVAAVAVSWSPAAADGILTVTFLDVGQADATLLQHDEARVLIDTGMWQRSDVVEALEVRAVDDLDLIVVTHPHADHIGQFDRVIESVEVADVWWSGATVTSQTFDRAVAALEASDAAYDEPRTGDSSTIGPLELEVLNPPTGHPLTDVHDSGLALRVTFGEVRLLFTGDIEERTEQRMVSTVADRLDADLYQVGHHGSVTSTSAPFLSAVSPTVAVYSAGAGNQYGHPSQTVVDRMEAAGVTVYGTDINGTVTATTDGTTVTVTPETGTSTSFTAGDGTSAPPIDSDPDGPSDIVGTTHEQAIRRIVGTGIASGYPDGTYHPDQPVTRAQMATFLTRALPLASLSAADMPTVTLADYPTVTAGAFCRRDQAGEYGRTSAGAWMRCITTSTDSRHRRRASSPPPEAQPDPEPEPEPAPPSCTPLSDICGNTHEDAIRELVAAGIAGGYSDGTYRPAHPVTRGHMATFLTRGWQLPAGTATFTDTPGTTHADSIASVATAEIAGGYPDRTYRPTNPVTRGQMATFIDRALDLP